MLIMVVSTLASALDCTYIDLEDDVVTISEMLPSTRSKLLAVLDSKPEWQCWAPETSQQPAYAMGALFCLLFYIPSSILLAPFVTADSDAIFQPHDLDVRFTPRFLLMDRAAKVFLTLLTILWGTRMPVVVLLVQFNVHAFLWSQSGERRSLFLLGSTEMG
eukprot:SAG31_NODE_4995_length_2814_cov_1.128545_4_plen_161_part_00